MKDAGKRNRNIFEIVTARERRWPQEGAKNTTMDFRRDHHHQLCTGIYALGCLIHHKRTEKVRRNRKQVSLLTCYCDVKAKDKHRLNR